MGPKGQPDPAGRGSGAATPEQQTAHLVQPLGIGMVGYAFMGAAHSQGWRTAGRVFDLPRRPARMEWFLASKLYGVADPVAAEELVDRALETF
ncbi:hypothetical protein ABZ350_04575, partial [Streptomyces uncialis]